MTDTNLSLIRAAAFQAQTDRFDFKTQGVKKCKPPNRRCGDRCIPPGWDCRLRGEGNDPHLKAVGKGSDPVGGFSNLERSFQRLGKGVTKLSFTELEASRRAFSRGAAKLHPGDLKEKEKAKERAFQFATWVATPAAVLVLAGLGHRGLKSNKAYRNGVGRKVDQAVEDTVYNISRNTPFVGGKIRAREAAARTSLNTLGVASYRRSVGSTRAITNTSGRNRFLTSTARRQASFTDRGDVSGLDAVRRSLRSVDSTPNGGPSRLSYSEWQPKSLQAFWRTKLPSELRGELTGDGATSLFAVGATNNLLRRTYNLPVDYSAGVNLKSDAARITRVIESRLRSSRAALLADMKQRNLDPGTDLDSYLNMQRRYWSVGDEAIDSATHESVKRLLSSSDVSAYAREQYITTRKAFDHYFQQIGTDMTVPPSINNPTFNRGARARSPYADGLQGHAEGLARMGGLDWPTARIKSPEMAELVRRAYHAKVVMGQSNPTVAYPSTRSLKAVALEISGRTGAISTEEAVRIVSEYLRPMGFAGVTPPRSGRGDSAYEAAFVATTTRLDKRCGKSAIPDDRKCHLPTAGAATKPKAAAPKSIKPQEGPSTLQKVATGAAVLGAVAGGAAAYKNRKAIGHVAQVGAQAAKTGAQAAGAAAGVVQKEFKRYGNIKAQKLTEKNSYGGQKHTEASAARAARQQMIAEYRQQVPHVSKAVVARLSAEDVRQGLSQLPKEWQEPARNLVGFAKKYAVTAGLQADGMRMVKVDNDNNFSTFIRDKDGYVASVGSVGDSVLVFGSERKGDVKGVAKYGMAFTVDQTFEQRKGLSREQGLGIAKATKAMYKDQLDALPDNVFIFAKPFKDDGLGAKREAIYKRWGFKKMPGEDEMWGMKDQGEFRKLSDDELARLRELLNARDDSEWTSSKSTIAPSSLLKKAP